MINKYITSLLLFVMSMACSAQDLASVLFGKSNKSDYIGQYKDNTKKKNGLGILRMKNGDVYIGDFSEGKLHGRGMLVAAKESLDGLLGTKIFVGNFSFGKRERNGVCYAESGEIIYRGRFVDDKPLSTYPQLNVSTEDFFTIMPIGSQLFWGETHGDDDTPNGMSIMVEQDGTIMLGQFENGKRVGNSLCLLGSGEWEAGLWKEGKYTVYNSSAGVANRTNIRKQNMRAAMSEMWTGLMQVAVGLQQVANDFAQQYYSAEEGGTASASSGGGGGGKNGTWTCTYCKGKRVCNACDGSGQDIRNIPGTNQRKTCHYCHGRKTCQKCKGKGIMGKATGNSSSINPNSINATCRTCHGSGTCAECAGSGTTSINGHSQTCFSCKGNGKCVNCKGGKR